VNRFRSARLPNGLILVLAYGAIAIPVAGWIFAQSSTARTTEPWQFTGAMIHGLAASTFAVIFAVSAIINATIVTFRFRDAPISFRLAGYPLWQAIVITLGIGWAVIVALTIENNLAEMAFGLGIAAASIGACIQASWRDDESSAQRASRLAARREARTPATRRIVRIVQLGVPVVIVAATVTAIIAAQLLVTVHRDCEIYGTGDVNGALSIYTTPCGDFAVDATRISPAEIDRYFSANQPVDVTTQGYAFGIPPVPVLIGMELAD
jgi:hypothetical protein